MQVHDGFNINDFALDAKNNRVRETMKVKLTVITPNFLPAIRGM
jgi:hypothetical protein